jgi:hypothetical protein
MEAQTTRLAPTIVCAVPSTMHFHLGLVRIVVMQMDFLRSVDSRDSRRALPILGEVGPVRNDAAGAAVGALIGTMTSIYRLCVHSRYAAYVNGLEVWRQARFPDIHLHSIRKRPTPAWFARIHGTSMQHADHPYVSSAHGQEYQVNYLPAESDTSHQNRVDRGGGGADRNLRAPRCPDLSRARAGSRL